MKWVKNERLGFAIPYRNRGLTARYIPDFIIETDSGLNLILEIKGQMSDDADVKAKAASRWVGAVNRLKTSGEWRYLLVTDPGRVAEEINAFTSLSWTESAFQLI